MIDARIPGHRGQCPGALRRLAGACLLALTAACSTAAPPSNSNQNSPLIAASPRDAVAWPFTFTWSGASADDVVRVRVFDEAERAVYEHDTRGASLPAPDELRTKLRPGSRYLWRAARIDANGQEVGASELTGFSLR